MSHPSHGRPLRILATLSLLVPLAVPLAAQDATSILETARQEQAERWSTVRNYTVTKAIEAAGGMQTPMYYEKFESPEGEALFRLVMPGEYTGEVLEQAGFPPPTPDQMRQMAGGYDMVGGALAQGGGDMPPMPGVGNMMGSGGTFLRAAAAARETENDGRADAIDAAADMREFAARARLEGRGALDLRAIVRELEAQFAGGDDDIVSWVPDEALQSREAFHLVVDDLTGIELQQPAGGGKYSIDRAEIWLDAEHFVPLRLRMTGEVENEGRTTPLTIEKFDLDHRRVGPLYEPFVEVFRISGLMSGLSEKERKEMEKARADLARARAQLEAMPADQRAMVERMMKGQLEKAERMLAGDAMVTSVRTVSLAVNEGPPTPYGPGTMMLGSVTFPGALTVASEAPDASGRPRAALEVAARDASGSEASISLRAEFAFPAAGGSVAVVDGDGWLRRSNGTSASFDDANGVIEVTARTDTRIVGTFTATLTGTDGDGNRVTANASGTFDTGAPVGPGQAPRGSPIPGSIFELGPPPGSPAAGSGAGS